MRALATLIGLALAAGANAQLPAPSIVTSPAPGTVAVTVYRNPDRAIAPLNLPRPGGLASVPPPCTRSPGRGTEPRSRQWLGGYALVSETRRVTLPAGESELRFEGVTSGIVPQSAIVTRPAAAALAENR